MGVGSVQPVGNAMVHILRLGRWIKVLHGAEIFGGDRLEGRRPETSLENKNKERAKFRALLEDTKIVEKDLTHSYGGRAREHKSQCFYKINTVPPSCVLSVDQFKPKKKKRRDLIAAINSEYSKWQILNLCR